MRLVRSRGGYCRVDHRSQASSAHLRPDIIRDSLDDVVLVGIGARAERGADEALALDDNETARLESAAVSKARVLLTGTASRARKTPT